MPRIAFADESGTDDHSRCYAIGAVSVPEAEREAFEQRIVDLKATHGVLGEAKWTRVRNGHGLINFVLDCLDLILTSPDATFDVIVVHKQLYKNWQGGAAQQEVAFYKTYTYLLRHIVRRLQDTARVLIDARWDRYGKRDEAMLTIGNRMLARLASRGRLGAVTKVDSHQCPGVQCADVLTGWHFPTEFRGPSRDPGPRVGVPYVTADDLGRANIRMQPTAAHAIVNRRG
jgi:hypothetical protein